MSGGVWISDVLSATTMLPEKLGSFVRHKFRGQDWQPIKSQFDAIPEQNSEAASMAYRGETVSPNLMPEAAAIYNEDLFAKAGDFFLIGLFIAVKGELAKVLSRFDLGEGGLVPVPLFKADLVTPHEVECYILNFGAFKRCLVPEKSVGLAMRGYSEKKQLMLYKVQSWIEDRKVAVSSDALIGPDLWFDPALYRKTFVSEQLAVAIKEIGMADTFELDECLVGVKR
jgi:hypothetical protein